MRFLGRARKFLQELASEPEGRVQYFNVTCCSGHRVRGERTEGYQALRCPACGDGVFVLPRSPLPEPTAPARSPRSGGARRARGPIDDGPVELTDPGRAALDVAGDEAASADAEIIWDDGAETPRHSARDRGRGQPDDAGAGQGGESEEFWEEDLNRAAAAPARDANEGRRKRPGPVRSAEAEAPTAKTNRPANVRGTRPGMPQKAPAAAVIEIQPARKKPGLITLVLILVPVMVVTAIAWRYWRSVRQEYPLIAEKGRTEGIPALKEGNFDKAFQLLSAAKTAVEGLGGEVEGAQDILTAADEAAIFVNLCAKPLEDMLEEAGRTDPDIWESTFDTLYKGRTIIVIDSVITDVPASGTSSSYMLDRVILPPGGPSNFADVRDARPDKFGFIDLRGFELFEQSPPKKGDHVTFGAKLASFKRDGEAWWVGLEPKSGVYIVHSEALQAVGFAGAGKADPAIEAQP